MPTNFELEKAYNENLLDELQFTLQDRKEPTLVMISVPTYDLQVKVLSKLKDRLSQYQFYDIDLTPFQVISLHQTLQEKLPKSITESERITYCVNVFGLENSRLSSEDGKIVDSGMIAQLNFEREIIFRKPNYITILWGDHDFFIQLQRKAPDLWSWVTNFFVFKQDEIHQEKELSPQPHEIPAKLPVREEYIKSLKDKLEHLPLNDTDKGRAMRERLNLYSLLADEYAKYFDFENAKKYYENAIGVAEKLKVKGYDIEKLFFDYGTLNLDFRNFGVALKIYQRLLDESFQNDNVINVGNIYHNVGRVYQEQRNWSKAIENFEKSIKWHNATGQFDQIGIAYGHIGIVWFFQKNWDKSLRNYKIAIEWIEKTGQEHQLGGIFHNIGILYEEQKKWEEALENFHKSIDLKGKTGQEHQIGGSFVCIGNIFLEQKKWITSLEYYKKAIFWNKKTGQEYQLGIIYHNIGMLYKEQRRFDESLKSYQKAIYQKAKSGREYELGETYYHIGLLYEEQENNTFALENFEKALSFVPEYFEEEKEFIKESIERVNDKLSEKS